MTNPQGILAEDAERWWRAYQLAENDQAGELREHAQAGDEHARRQLAGWLSRLHQRAADGEEFAREFLAGNPDWQQHP